jgi:hypothetical protein
VTAAPKIKHMESMVCRRASIVSVHTPYRSCHLPVKKSEVWPLSSLLSPTVDPYCHHTWKKRDCARRLLHHLNELASSSHTHGRFAPNAGASIRRLPRPGRVRTLPFICRDAIMMLIDWLAASWWLYTAVVIALAVCRVPLFIPLTI